METITLRGMILTEHSGLIYYVQHLRREKLKKTCQKKSFTQNMKSDFCTFRGGGIPRLE